MTESSYYAHGKLLLTSEYFVMDGAQALALPTQPGQGLHVEENNQGYLSWSSFDCEESIWCEAEFNLEDFQLRGSGDGTTEMLQKILVAIRAFNPDFLKDSAGVTVKTYLEFPKEWGLGSSSTLISMLADWADICPHKLLQETFGGSGYDIACAQADGAVIYEQGVEPVSVDFWPSYREHLYFVYLNQKQNSRDGIAHYKSLQIDKAPIIQSLDDLTDRIMHAKTLGAFEALLGEHEALIAEVLQMQPVKAQRFSDYWGQVKSLGAWGGDFALVTSDKNAEKTKDYFISRGYDVMFPFDELVL